MKRIILGTDWWSDCDDAVAIRLLTRAARRGEIELAGICINACDEHSVASLKAFLKLDGTPDVPIGIDREATDFKGKTSYQRRLASYMPELSNADGEEGVRFYRRLLAETDGKLDILEIGFLQVVAAVLKSGGDDISPKSGIELFCEKVNKVWVMAGKWDVDGGLEHNFCNNNRSRVGGKEFCRLCPVPITFLGYETGLEVITGSELVPDDHLYVAMSDRGARDGRESWDPMLVMMALTGDEEAAGYASVSGKASVDEETGANHFLQCEDGMHRYVVKKRDNGYYRESIDRAIDSADG